jgi:hypothetical protein
VSRGVLEHFSISRIVPGMFPRMNPQTNPNMSHSVCVCAPQRSRKCASTCWVLFGGFFRNDLEQNSGYVFEHAFDYIPNAFSEQILFVSRNSRAHLWTSEVVREERGKQLAVASSGTSSSSSASSDSSGEDGARTSKDLTCMMLA